MRLDTKRSEGAAFHRTRTAGVAPDIAQAGRRRHATRPIKNALAVIAIVLVSGTAAAQADVTCAGDARLGTFSGVWAQPAFLAALTATRSWHDALQRVDDRTAVAYVEQNNIYFSLAWHEGDAGGHCLRSDGRNIWIRPGRESTRWLGPYVRTAAKHRAEEAPAFLGPFFKGCFTSELRERWCLSPDALTIDGKPYPLTLQEDLSEAPTYGTAFRSSLTQLPFLVFVPRDDGWAVYEDDWASAEGRKPIDPMSSKAWHQLKR